MIQRSTTLILLILALAFVGYYFRDELLPGGDDGASEEGVEVVRVADGDTIRVKINGEEKNRPLYRHRYP